MISRDVDLIMVVIDVDDEDSDNKDNCISGDTGDDCNVLMLIGMK